MDSPVADRPTLRAHLLGPVRLAIGDRAIEDRVWPRRTARSLLLLLLATPGHRLPRDRVLELLWPEAAPDSARNALYLALSGLRRTLEPDRAGGRASGYVDVGAETIGLRPGFGLWVDADALEAVLSRPRDASADDRFASLREALALYEGDLLAEEGHADWAVARRERLRRAWRRAVLELAGLGMDGGGAAAAAGLERLLAADPTDETATRALMRTLAESGRWEEAHRHYERCVQALRDELGAEPAEETRALAASLRTPPTAWRPAGPVPRDGDRFDNLPTPPNALVGRERDVAALQDMLWDPSTRLVTVTGPGGIGKTRLAIEAASQLVDDFEDGVCFVGLAALREPGLVVATVARTLGIEEEGHRPIAETLGQALRRREVLLVLDNFEQVLGAAPAVAAAIDGCPRVKLLVTSRAPLRLPGERELPLSPLTLPDEAAGGTGVPRRDVVARYEAIDLFRQRAAAVRPGFALTDANLAAVVSVCRRLDGLPLAIELAAARSRTRAPEDLLAGLADRFGLLSGGYRDLPARQRTMRDAIGWSYDLLSEPGQRLFRRLAVFVGGWTREAAVAICAAGGTSGGGLGVGLTSLVDASLIRREDGDGDPERFGMLETIRDFAAGALAASGDEAAIRGAHAAYFLALAERTGAEAKGAGQAAGFARLAAEHDNLRAAMDWSLAQGDVERALRIATAVHEFWLMRGHIAEGRERLDRALARGEGLPGAVRAAGYSAAASLASAQDELARSEALHRQALALWQACEDMGGCARSLKGIGAMRRRQGDFDGAVPLLDEALRLSRAAGDRETTAAALNELAMVTNRRGDRDAAEALHRESLACYQELDDREGAAHVLNNLSVLAHARGDDEEARGLTESALGLFRACGDTFGVAAALSNLGAFYVMLGDPEGALAILQEGIDVASAHGHKHYLAISLFNQADALRRLGRTAEALAVWGDRLAVLLAYGDRVTVADAAEELAGALATLARPARATRLWSAAHAYRERLGIPRRIVDPAAADHPLRVARDQIGEAAFAAALDEGRTMAIEQAVAEALTGS